MAKVIFQETQRFNQWWIWLLITGVIIASYSKFYATGETDLLRPFILTGLILLFLLGIRLKTRIDENGIHVSFFPFLLKTHTYKWDKLYSVEVIEYSPLSDFGGWGYRISFSGKGRAFSIRGNKGIQISTDEGKKRIIGTQKPLEAKVAIENYFIKN